MPLELAGAPLALIASLRSAGLVARRDRLVACATHSEKLPAGNFRAEVESVKSLVPSSSGGQSGPPALTRREWQGRGALGFGSLARVDLLASEGRLVAADTAAATTPATAPPPAPVDAPPHFPARARSVIFLFMGGGPSHVDTFDPKPELTRLHGHDVPESIARNIPRIARSPRFNLMGSPWKFSPHGRLLLFFTPHGLKPRPPC